LLEEYVAKKQAANPAPASTSAPGVVAVPATLSSPA
jgi:hypothetical protein